MNLEQGITRCSTMYSCICHFKKYLDLDEISQLEYLIEIFIVTLWSADSEEDRCLLCMMFKVLTHLWADIPAELPDENIKGLL